MEPREGPTQVFFPPELASSQDIFGEASPGEDLGNPLKQLFLRKSGIGKNKVNEDKKLAEAVLRQARLIVAHPSRPVIQKKLPWSSHPFGEIDLEASLEETPNLEDPFSLIVAESREKEFSCVAMLDCSMSMEGEKHLLSSIAVAVLLLEVPAAHLSVVSFGSQTLAVKKMGVEEPTESTVQRFLRVQPGGFTNIASALREGIKECGSFRGSKRKVGILVTDGRVTEGEDPFPIAAGFDFLLVLHTKGTSSYEEGSRELAERGNGICLTVERYEELPRRLYEAVRAVAR